MRDYLPSTDYGQKHRPEADEPAVPAPALGEGAIWLLRRMDALPVKIQWQCFFHEWTAVLSPERGVTLPGPLFGS